MDEALGFTLLGAEAFEPVAAPLLLALPFGRCGTGWRDGGTVGVVEVEALLVDRLSLGFD